MIQLYDAKISKCIAHFVGNKASDDGVKIALTELSINSITRETLGDYFFKPFVEKDGFYSFSHQSNLYLNTIYSYISLIFSNKERFTVESANIAKFLYEHSTHPKIKAGELYIAYIKNCILDGVYVDAIGIFKSETKDKFLKVSPIEHGFSVISEVGTNTKKLDKGCLIFNKEKEKGYLVSVVDNTNKGSDAQYWIDDFLHVQQIKDSYSNTDNIMTLAKSFVTKELSKTGEVSKAEQIRMLNNSFQYLKDHDTFDLSNFTKEVISNSDIIDKFNDFKRSYEHSHDIEIDREFLINRAAIKKQQRSYKRAITLDKKIQIIIDGDLDQIERGVDSKGKFYKIYYRNEE